MVRDDADGPHCRTRTELALHPHLPKSGRCGGTEATSYPYTSPTQAKAALCGAPAPAALLKEVKNPDPPTRVSHAGACAWEPSLAQDDSSVVCFRRTANFVEAEYDGQFVKTLFVFKETSSEKLAVFLI